MDPLPLTAADLEEALDVLSDVLFQACRLPDGTVDSSALGAYADGLRLLAKHERFSITHEAGRRVIGFFLTTGPFSTPPK